MLSDNYPEAASIAIFLNPPPIFSAIIGIVKRWLPEETKRKIHFVSGERAPDDIIRYVRPNVIVATQRMLAGEYGDILTTELTSGNLSTPVPGWKQSFEKMVSARNIGHQYFVLSKTGTKTITWKRDDEGESPKSLIRARILYIKPEQEVGIPPDDVVVETIEYNNNETSVNLPSSGVNEALLVLVLDHSASWMKSHKFRVTVEGK